MSRVSRYKGSYNYGDDDDSSTESENISFPISNHNKKSKRVIYNLDSDESDEFIIPKRKAPNTIQSKSRNQSSSDPMLDSLRDIHINTDTPYTSSQMRPATTSKIRTQAKLTDFFTPFAHQRSQSRLQKKEISPQTALKNTPYRGLNVSVRNKYDNMSARRIKEELSNCQQILNSPSILNGLPDHGKRIKSKIMQLDEALIRVQAREVIENKNKSQSQSQPLKQKLDFSAKHAQQGKTNIVSHHRNPKPNIPRGLIKNLDKNNLHSLINSIQSMNLDVEYNHSNDSIPIPKDLKATLYPHQREGFAWMLNRETHNIDGQPYGGIIADEMGLGKTMQMITLMLHKHEIPLVAAKQNSQLQKQNHSNTYKSNCTLIVCPLSLMEHWESEIKKFSKKGRFVISKYHGNNRLKDVERLVSNYNVIITTYGSVQSEWNEWKKLEDKRLSEMKDAKRQIMIYQRTEKRYGELNSQADKDKYKKLKMKLSALMKKKYTKPILSQILFKRIVLDEAHSIKNFKSKTHKAICHLNSRAYWFMTATPIQNTLDDLFAAFHFLKYKYYSDYKHWKQGIVSHSKGIQRIRTLLAIVMLRRLKSDYIQSGDVDNANDNDEEKKECVDIGKRSNKKVIKLPPKKMINHVIEFNEYERFIYKQLSSLCNKIFTGYQESGSVGKNFSQCLKMLLQLRQACNHLYLIKESVYRIHSIIDNYDAENESNNMDISQLMSVMNKSKNNNKNDHNDDSKFDTFECSQQYMNEIKSALESGDDECPFCLDTIPIGKGSITSCGHRFCTDCLNQIIYEREQVMKKRLRSKYHSRQLYFECAVCRRKLTKSNITRLVDKKKVSHSQDRANDNLNKPSSKLEKLMQILEQVHDEHPSDKCIIFSQWTSYLDIIEDELEEEGYGYCRLDGKMTAKYRDRSIKELNTNSDCWIMLISLKAGGVGLNLVSANHVFMMDIWWNPAVEDQAFDRVHRIGQQKNVSIHRIIIKDSVEQKVLKLQTEKRRIANEALSMNNHGNKKKKRGGLSARDLLNLFGAS